MAETAFAIDFQEKYRWGFPESAFKLILEKIEAISDHRLTHGSSRDNLLRATRSQVMVTRKQQP